VSRIDYYDDPDAPAANSLRVAASAVVQDGHGRVLLQRRRDNGLWALPGGGMDAGESIGQAAAREVAEETGYRVEPEYVIGVYSDPKHVFAYDDGEVRQEFSVCVACRLVGGELAVSGESHEVGWFAPDAVEHLDMHPRIRVRITDFLGGRRAVVS
jgi:8-oxo-dGTP pyrophosphatase MutT (NUDIX family)